jgi:predicted TPR repeat methyltransferase
MLAEAARKNLYAELREADLMTALAEDPGGWAAVLAADVFCYLGPLGPLLAVIRRKLQAGGVFVFSVECVSEADAPRGWQLGREGRYAHTREHVRSEAGQTGFEIAAIEEETLRFDCGAPVPGLIVTLSA